MNCYTITPNKDATGWFVKIENTAPAELYTQKDAAIEAGIDLAKTHAPSKLVILDKNHQEEEVRKFQQRSPS
ncbi:DUF2188 domain-containing protein [Salinithrix halophila]|uniref:DUF2188 domain-containing protein n=1 Tax=Salinithrix halophila TaxID=1485204 RepID=A0ABV8JHX7_9BACL